MELDELEQRLPGFVAAKYGRDDLSISGVHKMPGHAGFAYGFTVSFGDGAADESWFLRLPPPNVNWRGTADVLRQVAVLNALDGSDVPHCSVQWSGDDLEHFERPYFVVPKLDGDVLRMADEEWGSSLSDAARHRLGKQIMTALAGIHRIPLEKVGYLGEPVPFAEDVERWDRFYERAAEPSMLSRAPEARALLLSRVPESAPVGVFHGDFQTANLFCSPNDEQANLKAVIDFELCGVGATLNDVGWIATFSDPDAWPKGEGARPMFLDPDTLVGYYREAWGEVPDDQLNWFRALAAYKFAIITGFNLYLHRSGKREDDTWENTALAQEGLIERALDLLA